MPIILALRELKQVHSEFRAHLGNTVSIRTWALRDKPWHTKKAKTNRKTEHSTWQCYSIICKRKNLTEKKPKISPNAF